MLLFLLGCLNGWAQSASVSGKVISGEDGKPLPGVNVVIKGTTTGTVTDVEGSFALNVTSEDVLVFSFIGYQSQEVRVGGQTHIAVTLQPDTKTLDEVVVIGYGEQSRATLTTSISRVAEEEFQQAPAANPLLQLQGKVAGVSIQASNGQPGANPEIFIRGGSSTSPENDNPLFIVDGIVGQMRNISDLNPDDIESIQVLKDAASTAIYGVAAANGVIIVKTKSGRAARKPTINFKVTGGVEELGKRYNFVNARDYIYVSRLNTHKYNTTNPEFFLSGGTYGMSTGNPRNSRNTLEFLDVYLQDYGQDYVADLLENQGWQTMTDPVTGKPLIFKETNFQDVTFQRAYRQEYDFNISGGNERATYYVSLGHLNQDGIVYGSYYKNYSALFKGTYQLSNKWSLNANVGYQLRTANAPSNYNNVLSRSVTTPPTYRLYYEDGTPAPGEGISSFRSRLHEVYYKERYTDVDVYRFTANLGANWDILPGLTFSPSFYWFTTEGVENRFEAYNETNRNRTASADHNLDRQTQLDGVLTYDKLFNARHHVNVVLGTSYINRYVYRMEGSGRGAPTDYIPTLNATALETQRVSTRMETDIWASYFARATYDFDRRYLFSASLRMDGSSRFAEDNKFGYFAGVSAGWNIHEEDFWQDMTSAISTLKLRSSWGEVGSDELTIANSQGAYSVTTNYNGAVGILNTSLANHNLIWETTRSFDIGMDIGLLDNRINLLVDYYNKLTTDRLFDKPLDGTTGFSSIKSNYGSIRNSGVEVELHARPVETENFSWDVGFTFAFNRGVVVELPENGEDKDRVGGNYVYDPELGDYKKVGGFAEGERFGQRYAFHMIGVYPTDEDAEGAPYDVNAGGRPKKGGDAIWNDLDGNGIIDNNDMVFMGYIRPDKTGGMVNTLRFKGLTARVVVDYAIGHVIDNGFRAKANGSSRNNNVALTDVLSNQMWQNPGDVARYPRYTVQSDIDYNFRNHQRWDYQIGNTGTASNNSLYYSKGDFLAFREVSLSYQLNRSLLTPLHLEGLELFAGVFNLGYITEYDGLMPEVYQGNDPGLYPRPRQYNFGLRATF